MNNIYRKSFVFQAERFEEYQNGKCISQGSIDTEILAKVVKDGFDEVIVFNLRNNRPISINFSFGLPIFGIQAGDVLSDRIQYGRLPDSMSWADSNEPLVCNIFNNMQCIRFAMCSPLRIIEFFGSFTTIGN